MENDKRDKVFEVRFDGSCWPNPGGECRYGWVLYEHDPENYDEPVLFASGSGPVSPPPGGITSNNLAEWSAVRAALEWASCLNVYYTKLLIRGDSRLVVDQFNGTMKCKARHLRPIRDYCRSLAETLRVRVEVSWIPREENNAADRMAGR